MSADESGVPGDPRCEGGPSAHPQQQGVHERDRRRVADPEFLEGEGGDGHRVVGQRPDRGPESLQTHDLRRAVEGRFLLPRAEHPETRIGRAPQGLTAVEVRGGPRRDAVGTQPCPITARRRRCDLRRHGRRTRRRFRSEPGQGQQLLCVPGSVALRPKSFLDVALGDVAPLVGGAVEVGGHRGARTDRARQRARRVVEVVVEEAEVGVHRHEALEGPQRRDPRARGPQHPRELVEVLLVDGGACQFHVGSREEGEAGTDVGCWSRSWVIGETRSSMVDEVGFVRSAPIRRS